MYALRSFWRKHCCFGFVHCEHYGCCNCQYSLFLSFYKKKTAAGEKLKIQYNKKTIVIYVIVSVFVIIFIIWTLFCGSIDISFHDNDLLLRHRME